MPIVQVDDPQDPRLGDYRDVPDPVLLRERGIFVAESRLVVRELLAHPHLRTRSLLVTEAALESLRDLLDARPGDHTIYVGTHQFLKRVVGYKVHRGCLAVGERPPPRPDTELPQLASARLVVVLENVGNPDNVGGIFRNAAAFGAACVLLSPNCCDPLYRKAIRTSLGATLRVPYGIIEDWPHGLARLRDHGFTVAALTPDPDADDLESFIEHRPPRVVLLLGTEGPGLSAGAVDRADRHVRIPIAPGIDSLNVATASGIALHRLGNLS
ncbi:MAG: rRNA methyltransferase [Acidobacteria bacterium]|jgi:tRNA G18 (ribose-2'-O)-methylase SpoU|nr:rRNA methyltransferase [Acidobacteriota bacterium]MDP7338007.1 RNA methyltransferase [Vicinamibacterales bacterium]MDP7478914.1 RNA methyltransferase [Vicinamibacterales bacterium]HJN46531.1 RNA methyltransferase [Vicinamibacterales bacterium]|tara:strand:+ start:57 stop:866 length:810 start_codon:yes stop_codon:yes gene_type:complete